MKVRYCEIHKKTNSPYGCPKGWFGQWIDKKGRYHFDTCGDDPTEENCRNIVEVEDKKKVIP